MGSPAARAHSGRFGRQVRQSHAPLVPPPPLLAGALLALTVALTAAPTTPAVVSGAAPADTPATDGQEASIRLTRFQVPQLVRAGEAAKLSCHYELAGARLHAMKLFKDGQEFYRFTPAVRHDDPRLTFNVSGVSVDMSRSNERDVWLRSASKRTSGLYKCQVSVEDTFKSVSSERRLEVGARGPHGGPTVAGNSYIQAGPASAANGNQPGASSRHHQQQQQRRQLGRPSTPADSGASTNNHTAAATNNHHWPPAVAAHPRSGGGSSSGSGAPAAHWLAVLAGGLLAYALLAR